MKGLTDKEELLMGYLISKVLIEKKGLNEEEMKQLKDILNKLLEQDKKEEAEQKKKVGLSDVLDRATNKAMIQVALKKSEELNFNALPFKEQAKQLTQKVNELKNSHAFKELDKQKKEREEAEAFEEFYQAHVKKNGNQL